MLTGPPVTLSSAHLTSEQVAKWVQHQRTQLEAGTFAARTLTTTISERSWIMIGFKIASSRTLRENPANDWRKDWNMDTFLKALEEVYWVEPADRFMETGSIWQAIAIGLCRNLEVDPADMSKLSEKYVAVLVEKKLLHPLREKDSYQTLKNLLYKFVARDNPAKDSRSNRTFHAEFQQALKDDPDYQRHANIEQFLLVCEKLIYKWQQVQFQYDFRNDKRAPSPSDASRNNKKSKSSQPPRDTASIARAAVSLITSERTVPPGTILSTPTSTRKGSGWAAPPTRQSSHGWPPKIAQASTRPCDSSFAPMEQQWCLSRERSRIDNPKETPGHTGETHPPPVGVGATINHETTSERSGAPCTSESMRRTAREEVRVSSRPQ